MAEETLHHLADGVLFVTDASESYLWGHVDRRRVTVPAETVPILERATLGADFSGDPALLRKLLGAGLQAKDLAEILRMRPNTVRKALAGAASPRALSLPGTLETLTIFFWSGL